MAETDEQLVQIITQQVIEAIRAQTGVVSSPSSVVDSSTQTIKPPAGICTGDYSKFQEPDASQPTIKPAKVTKAVLPTAPALDGFVTAQQIEEAVRTHGHATLAAQAKLTPLAHDYVRLNPLSVRRLDHHQTAMATVTPTERLPWMMWSDGFCPIVQQVTAQAQLRQRLHPIASSETLMTAIDKLATKIDNKTIEGGILFVHSPMPASVLVNRYAGLRGVVAKDVATVTQAMAEVGVNVLMVPYPKVGQNMLEAMLVELMVTPPQVPQGLTRMLDEAAQKSSEQKGGV